MRFKAFLLLAHLSALAACGNLEPKNAGKEEREAARTRAVTRKLQEACSSPATYDRLKQVAFDEAIRIRNADPVNLDTLASHSFVRMEEPRVVSRDEKLDVTVCSGRFVLVLPLGAERAFDGDRQLTADVEYAAQAAADGTGLVYQIKGAEPIIYKLAAFDLKHGPASPAAPRTAALTPPPVEVPQPEQAQQPRPAASIAREAPRTVPVPQPEPAPPRPRPARQAEDSSPARAPSFNCARARSRSERMVCSDGALAGLDRAMSSRFYSALSRADPAARAELRRTRDRFLGYRERCPTESCVAQAYRDRMAEIADIAGEP